MDKDKRSHPAWGALLGAAGRWGLLGHLKRERPGLLAEVLAEVRRELVVRGVHEATINAVYRDVLDRGLGRLDFAREELLSHLLSARQGSADSSECHRRPDFECEASHYSPGANCSFR